MNRPKTEWSWSAAAFCHFGCKASEDMMALSIHGPNAPQKTWRLSMRAHSGPAAVLARRRKILREMAEPAEFRVTRLESVLRSHREELVEVLEQNFA